jgi:hypothetical protein
MIDLSDSEIWKIKDTIKYKHTSFEIGDEVILYSKKSNGYPKYLTIGETYEVTGVELNHITVRHTIMKGITAKVAKKYFITKSLLREIRINKILI